MADDVATLIEAASGGGASAVQALFARVYGELKILARKQLAGAAASTLNTTALVHEVYLKLAKSDCRDLHGRVHFFALVAKAMRQIVIDHARARLTGKRGGGNVQWTDIEAVSSGELALDELLRLDRALTRLGEDEPRLAQLVELRFFGGFELAEIALLQATSERTLSRDWRRAKAQLYVHLHPDV